MYSGDSDLSPHQRNSFIANQETPRHRKISYSLSGKPGEEDMDFFDNQDDFHSSQYQQTTYRRLLPAFNPEDNNYATTSSHHEGTKKNTHLRTASTATDKSFYNGYSKTKRFSTLFPQTKLHYKSNSNAEDPLLMDETEIYEHPVGQEPGVDVDTMFVDLPDSIGSQVTVMDYCPEDCKISHYDVEKDGQSIITGSDRKEMVQKNFNEVLNNRPKWSKVRWIVVNGLSWEVIKPIAFHYKLHPLAVEDMLDIPQRTKMEIFHEQLFCCYPLYVLNVSKTPYSVSHLFIRKILLALLWTYDRTRSGFLKFLHMCKIKHSENVPYDLEKNFQTENINGSFISEKGINRNQRINTFSESSSGITISTTKQDKQQFINVGSINSQDSRNEQDSLEIEECIPFYTMRHGVLCGNAYSSPLAEKIREIPPRSIYDWNQGNYLLRRAALQNMHIPGTDNSYEITHEQVSLFMVGDTIITFFEKSAPEIYGPLENRLKSHDTMLRQSSDPAILLQAILDVSVDLLGPILNAYRVRLNRLQVQSLQQPNLQHTRALHAFMTDLTILRPPIRSLANVISGFWSKFSAARKNNKNKNVQIRASPNASTERPKNIEKTFTGDSDETLSDYISNYKNYQKETLLEVAALYFDDVADHALRYLDDLDDMRNQSRTLSSLIFNTISIHGSDYMKMLSLVSVVFLPLTFLTGYFGMNFKTFTILDHDVAYYWVIAAPAAAALSAVVMYSSTKFQILEIWARAKAQL